MATFWNSTIATDAKPRTSSRLAQGFVRVATWIGERRARTQVLRELERMDERDLHDLRISPYDFNEIANGTFRR